MGSKMKSYFLRLVCLTVAVILFMPMCISPIFVTADRDAGGYYSGGAIDAGDPFAGFLSGAPELIPDATPMPGRDKDGKAVNDVTLGAASVMFADIPGAIIKDFRFYVGDKRRGVYAYGYIAYPLQAANRPAVIFYHGGGNNATGYLRNIADWVQKGFITMSITMPGVAGAAVNNGFWDKGSSYLSNGDAAMVQVNNNSTVDAKNATVYDAMMAATQGFLLLQNQHSGGSSASRLLPEGYSVDPTRVGCVGASWGGYATTFVSGILGDKVAASFSFFGTGGNDHPNLLPIIEKFNADEANQFRYIDAWDRVEGIRSHYMIDSPTNDQSFFPTTVMKSYKKMSQAKSSRVIFDPNDDHGQRASFNGWDQATGHLSYYLNLNNSRGGFLETPEPKQTGALSNADGSLTVTFDAGAKTGGNPITDAKVWVSEPLPWRQRVWRAIDTTDSGNGIYTATLSKDMVDNNYGYYLLVNSAGGYGFKQYVSTPVIATASENEIGAKLLSLTDSQNNIAYAVENGNMTVSVYVENYYTEQTTCDVIFAAYSDNKLLNCAVTPVSLDNFQSKTVSETIDCTGADRLAVFVWNGLEDIIKSIKHFNITQTPASPTAPSNLRVASDTGNELVLQWEKSQDLFGISGYDIYRNGAWIGSADTTSFTDIDFYLPGSQTYVYTVRAKNAGGYVSAASNSLSYTISGPRSAYIRLKSDSTPAWVAPNGTPMTDGYQKAYNLSMSAHSSAFDSNDDGKYAAATIAGVDCVTIPTTHFTGASPRDDGNYIYFKVDDSYISPDDKNVAVMFKVEYFDNDNTSIALQYGVDNGLAVPSEAYGASLTINKKGTQTWKTAYFNVSKATFAGGQNKGSDFRIFGKDNAPIASVTLMKRYASIVNLENSVLTDVSNSSHALHSTAGQRYIGSLLGISYNSGADSEYKVVSAVHPDDANALPAIATVPNGTRQTYIYGRVDSGYIKPTDKFVKLKLDYFDDDGSTIMVQYASDDPTNPTGLKQYFTLPRITRTDSKTWKTSEFTITNAEFTHLQNGYNDFRITADGGGTAYIRNINVLKIDEPHTRIIDMSTTSSDGKWALGQLGMTPIEQGLEDHIAPASKLGLDCISTPANDTYSTRVFVQTDASYIKSTDTNIKITYDYFDNGTDLIQLQYMSNDTALTAGAQRDHKNAANTARTGSNTWKTATINITDAAFEHRQASNCDFRIYGGAQTYIRNINVYKQTPPAPPEELEDLPAPDVTKTAYLLESDIPTTISTTDKWLQGHNLKLRIRPEDGVIEDVCSRYTLNTTEKGGRNSIFNDRWNNVPTNTTTFIAFQVDNNFITPDDRYIKITFDAWLDESSTITYGYNSIGSFTATGIDVPVYDKRPAYPEVSPTNKWVRRTILLNDAQFCHKLFNREGINRGNSDVDFFMILTGGGSGNRFIYVKDLRVTKLTETEYNTELANQ